MIRNGIGRRRLNFEIIDIDGKHVYVISIPRFSTIPHAVLEREKRIYYCRRGSTVRYLTSSELDFLYRTGGGTIIGKEETRDENYSLHGFLILSKFIFRNKENLHKYSRWMKIIGYSIFIVLIGWAILVNNYNLSPLYALIPKSGL